MTEVVNLATAESIFYSLPPNEAVTAAAEQNAGNFTTWEYEKKLSLVKKLVGSSGITYFERNGFCAKK